MDGGTVATVPQVAPVAQRAIQQSDGGMSLILSILIVALVIFFVVELFRSVNWPKEWREKKPFSCPVCLTFWASLIMGVLLWRMGNVQSALQIGLPSAGLALLLVNVNGYLHGPSGPPGFAPEGLWGSESRKAGPPNLL